MILEEFKIENDMLSGLKIAEVVSNEDPKAQERILVRVNGVHNMNNKTLENAVWAHHCSPYKNSSGDLPEPGDYVWVLFPSIKNPMFIVWIGFVISSFQNENKGTPVPEEPEYDIFGDLVL